MESKNVLIKDLDIELHKRLRILSTNRNQPMKDVIVFVIAAGLIVLEDELFRPEIKPELAITPGD